HIQVYKSEIRIYRDLPLRFAELGTVYRYERSGVLHGLLRVRGFTQDDAHIFCEYNQIEKEVENVIHLTRKFLDLFKFTNYEVFLSTIPPHYVGTEEMWEMATQALKNALETVGIKYNIAPGEGAFYGPKIDILITDALSRKWQCSTIQVDFNLPQRFQLCYAGKDNIEHTPAMIHRAILGSFERFLGILIEHFAGAFPVWLAPIQVAIIPVSEKQLNYADNLYNILIENNIRCEKVFDKKNVSSRIRESIIRKIPYMLIIGEIEEKNQTVAVRELKEGHIGNFTINSFLEKITPSLNVPQI
ncbi:MAG: threonine--tRNA ligase, partial [Planctomycetota bacterium]